MQNNPKDIIIISYKKPELTIQCVESVRSGSQKEYNIIIVDNNSSDDTVEILRSKLTNILIIENKKNFGYAAAVNIGLKNSHSGLVLISNNDVIYPAGSIDKMFDFLIENNKTAIAGPQQIYPNGNWQWSWGMYPGIKLGFIDLFFISNFYKKNDQKIMKRRPELRQTREVEFIDGASMFCRRDAINSVGNFDEDYFFYTEEADLCFRVRNNGWKIVFNPQVQITHLRGGSNNSGNFNPANINQLVKSKILFCRKHMSRLASKLYRVMEISYSFNLWMIYSIISKIKSDQEMKNKSVIMKNFFKYWSENKINA